MIWRCDLVPQYHAYRTEIEEAVRRVLESGRYVLAAEGQAFEEEFARYTGTAHAIGVANGTDALILALLALGVGPGDEVITTTFSAIPTASAILDTGATPVFVDIDPATFLIDLDQVARALTPRTKAVMPVHIFGNVVDIPALRSITGSIPIIEDACQAHGSTREGVRAGAMGDLAAFSFYPTKNLGGYGDGGMVTTDDAELASRIRLLRMYGMTDHHHTVISGLNSRLDELQAAILRAKLPRLDEMNERRRAIAERYRRELRADRFEHQAVAEGVVSNVHVFATQCRGDRDDLVRHLEARGIQTNIYYLMPLHLQEAHRHLGMTRGTLRAAEAVCDRVIALPMYAELAPEIQTAVIEAINEHER
jgi:dTDP-4-amino-4,6-dideoxygalactose transaminase